MTDFLMHRSGLVFATYCDTRGYK